jgi:HSP20 family protein
MSLIPRPSLDSDLTFTPLFRFLDEFNNYSGGLADSPAFTPKFDIHEHKHSFSLHGELPGVEKKDVEIDFSDPQVCV